ncbi:hypothetical protein BYT27DRAFT_7089668, partial [Phlegmacium glaucopus]
TADVRTIFIKKDDYIDPHTGLVESGHVCKVCQHPDHFTVYQERCNKLNIPMNERANPKPSGSLDRQGTLDAIVTKEPRAPTFTTSGLLDYIVELVVCEDKAFQLVEKGPFRHLLRYLRPTLPDNDIPHRKALRQAIAVKAATTEAHLRDILKVKYISSPRIILTRYRTYLARCHSPLMPGHLTLEIHFFQLLAITSMHHRIDQTIGNSKLNNSPLLP